MSTGHVLLGLLTRGPLHGYELKRAYDHQLPQAKPLGFGQVYATLGRLQRDGLVAADDREQAGAHRVRDHAGRPDGPRRLARRDRAALAARHERPADQGDGRAARRGGAARPGLSGRPASRTQCAAPRVHPNQERSRGAVLGRDRGGLCHCPSGRGSAVATHHARPRRRAAPGDHTMTILSGPILYARGVVRSYGRTPALRGVTLDVAEGEIVAVTGPSGCGKSTLLLCLAGILRPDAGEVGYRGDRIDRWSEAERARLRRSDFGVLFQFGQLVAELTAAENVALPLLLAG